MRCVPKVKTENFKVEFRKNFNLWLFDLCRNCRFWPIFEVSWPQKWGHLPHNWGRSSSRDSSGRITPKTPPGETRNYSITSLRALFNFSEPILSISHLQKWKRKTNKNLKHWKSHFISNNAEAGICKVFKKEKNKKSIHFKLRKKNSGYFLSLKILWLLYIKVRTAWPKFYLKLIIFVFAKIGKRIAENLNFYILY